jgi:hypothetical protein
VLGAGAVAIAAIVLTSLDRKLYFVYRGQDRIGSEHPTGAVLLVVIAAALETAVAYAVVVARSPSRAWARALSGLALLAPFGLVVSEVVVDAPVFWRLHMAWLGLVSAALAITAVVSGAVEAVALRRGKRDPSGE